MTKELIQTELSIDLAKAEWSTNSLTLDDKILGPVDHGWQRHQENSDSFTFGIGLLAGSSMSGSRRLVFTGNSAQWDGFYISSFGGGAYAFRHTGLNYVTLRGKAVEQSVLFINHIEGELQVELHPFDPSDAWKGYTTQDGNDLMGVFALQHAVMDKFGPRFPNNSVRVFAVGPAAGRTNEGTIGANTVHKGKLTATAEWCGRGGMGSQLLQQNNVVACIFGGDFNDLEMTDTKAINNFFVEHFGAKTAKYDLSVTTKYRFDPKLNTGGTFGVNLTTNRDRLMTYNYQSAHVSNDQRKRQHEVFIKNHYLKQFNEETIDTENYENCGEPCLVKCKKMNGIYKKDYEPYHALGPQLGIFDQRAAELINDHVDALGFDAIQTGGTLSWIMECLTKGGLEASQFGFPDPSHLKFNVAVEPEDMDVVEDSMNHALYAMKLVDAILWDERAAVFRKGIRQAAYELQAQFPELKLLDRAVFLNHGNGSMVPNQYWVPGMFSPMPVMGKYYVYYGNDYMAPEALGQKNVERMVYELITDNAGICRFHRAWSESIVDDLLKEFYGFDIDYKAHHFALAKAINDQEGHKSKPWETQRMAELFKGFIDYWQEMGLQDSSFKYYSDLCVNDLQQAFTEFWQQIYDGQTQAFEAGPDAIADALTDAQKKKLERSA